MNTRACTAALVVSASLLAACSEHAFVARPAEPPASVLFKGVHLFDARAGSMHPTPMDVLVTDGKIAAVQARVETVPPGARVMEGGALLPGLIDVHAHTGGGAHPPNRPALPRLTENFTAYLYAGVTGVLDVGSMTPQVFDLRAELRSGARLGPDMMAAGPLITAPGGHPAALLKLLVPSLLYALLADRFVREVPSPSAAAGVVDALVPHQPDVIKVALDHIPLKSERMDKDTLAALCTAAHARGLRVVAHIGSSLDAVDAAEAGVDALVHGVYTEAVSDAALEALARRKIPVAPTLSVWRAILRFGDAQPVFTALERELADADTIKTLSLRPTGMEDTELGEWARAVGGVGTPLHRDNVLRMHKAGITLLVGSDSANVGHLPGAATHMELDEMVAAGLSPLQVLQAATYTNARFLAGDKEPDVGVVEIGKRANLLLVRGDPSTDIARVHDIVAVMKDGVILERRPRP